MGALSFQHSHGSENRVNRQDIDEAFRLLAGRQGKRKAELRKKEPPFGLCWLDQLVKDLSLEAMAFANESVTAALGPSVSEARKSRGQKVRWRIRPRLSDYDRQGRMQPMAHWLESDAITPTARALASLDFVRIL